MVSTTAARAPAPDDHPEPLWARAVAASQAAFAHDELILQILPLSLVLALAPIFLRHYSQAPVYLRRSPYPRLKMTSALATIFINLASILFHRLQLDSQADAMVAASLVDLVTSLTVGIVLYIEHRHAIRASRFLAVFLLCSCTIDYYKLRYFYFDLGLLYSAAVVATTGALRFTLLFLEVVPRKLPVVNESVPVTLGDGAAPEEQDTIPYFIFPSPFLPRELRIAIRGSNLRSLPDEFAADRLSPKLKDYWKKELTPEELAEPVVYRVNPDPHKGPTESLIGACARIWKKELQRILIPRIVYATFTFILPVLLRAIINVVGKEDVSITRKLALLAATIVSFGALTVSKSAYAHMNYRLLTRLRGSLTTQVIDKNHLINHNQAHKHSTVALISTEIDGIAVTLPRVMELPVTFLETTIGVFMLSFFVGNACYWIFVPILVSNIFTWFWGFLTKPALTARNKSAQYRINRTTEILNQLAEIKMMGLGSTVARLLQRLREAEAKLSRRHRLLETATVPFVQMASLMTPVLIVSRGLPASAFAGALPPNVIFPTLALIAAIQGPLGRLLDAYSTITTLCGCFDRIQAFLSLPDRIEYRFVRNKTPPRRHNLIPLERRHIHPVEYCDVDIAPLDQREPVLFRVDFALTQGTITGIVGPPGTGKSTLLQGIIGEATIVEGNMHIHDEDMAICGQTTWLRDCSIMDNVIGPMPYDADFFNRAVECCLLLPDLQSLPGGADFVVGPNGRYLTHGQRQRVGIARTVYARTSVMLFDDPFGSLDRKTAVSIVFHLFGANGLLRKMGTTVALVTSLRECLDVVDRVLLMDGRGYATLEDRPFRTPAFEASVHDVLLSAQDGPVEELEDAEKEAIRRSLDYKRHIAPLSARVRVAKNENATPLHTMYIDAIGHFSTFLYVLLILALAIGEHMPNMHVQTWIDSHAEDEDFISGFTSAAAWTCVLGTVSYWALFVQIAPTASLELHHTLVQTVTGSTLTYLGVVNLGDVLLQFQQDTAQISRQLPFYSMRTVHGIFSLAIKFYIILSGASYFVIVLPLIVYALNFIQQLYYELAGKLQTLDYDTKAPLFKQFEESAEGLVHIRTFAWQRADRRISFGLLNISQSAFYYLYYVQQWLVVMLGMLITSIASALVAVALFFRSSATQTSIGLAFLTLSQLSWILERMFELFILLQASGGALERLRTIKDEAPQETRRNSVKPPEHWPARGSIDIEDVSVHYEPSSQSQAALQNLSVSIEGGTKVFLIGRTGSGKSSLLMALLGLVEYTGRIKIDNIDLSTLSREEIQSRLIVISQEQVKFDASIRVNLLPFTMNDEPKVYKSVSGEDAVRQQLEMEDDKRKADERDASLEQILRRFSMWNHIMRKGGLNARLRDAGYTHLEIQLLCVARSILRQRETGSKVVLIDEAMCGLDFWRDEVLQEAMRESFRSCTVLVVARQEEMIWDASMVMEMSQGQIANVARRHTNE